MRLIDADALLERLNYQGRFGEDDEIYNLLTNAPTVQRELVIDCRTCANRGVVNGSSQETFCEHCIHGTSWKRNYYEPLPAAPLKEVK